MADLAELLARVKAATGPDYLLDAAIWDAAYVPPPEGGPYVSWQAAARAFGWDIHVTASLDAALALVERVLPGWTGGVHKRGDGLWIGEIDGPYFTKRLHDIYAESGKTGPLAMLSVMLTALRQRPADVGEDQP